MSAPEARARENIAALPEGQAGRGVAVRESGLQTGVADYLLFADRRALGAVEAKKEGTPWPASRPSSPSTAPARPAMIMEELQAALAQFGEIADELKPAE